MSVLAGIVGLTATSALLPLAPGDERATRLAGVPEDLEVANDLFKRNGRYVFARRDSIAWSEDGRTVAYSALRGDELDVP